MSEIDVHEVSSQLEDMALQRDAAPPADTPESIRFRALPQVMQRRLLLDYPRILATAMHQYSSGEDYEAILLQAFESSAEMLRVRNSQGDAPAAVALVRGQDERAEKLVELAHRRNPAALDSRSQYGETLLMLSTSSSSAASLIEKLLQRDPTQLHRLYDIDGRNLLHHCALEESIDALDVALRLTATLIGEGRLSASQVSAAIHMNDRSGDTPMHLMAVRNRREMLSRLADFCGEVGIDINVDERQHRDRRSTPLMVAVQAGAVEAVEFLMSKGASSSEEDLEGQTAVSMAAGNVPILQILGDEVEYMDVSQIDRSLEYQNAPVKDEVCWLTEGHSAVCSVDSGIGSFTGSVNSAETDSVEEILQAQLKEIEARLLVKGKALLFLDTLSRLDSQLRPQGLVHLSDVPVSTAFSIWASAGLRVSPGLVMKALREVGE